MPSAVRAMGYAGRQRQPRRTQDEDLRVLPGSRSSERTVSPVLMYCFKLAIVFLIGLGAIAFIRVWLTASTTSTLIQNQKVTAQISTARSTGDTLEVKQAALANPSRIASVATTQLGMVPGSSVSYMQITDDVVATDTDGDISVSGSVSAFDPSYVSVDDMVAEQASSTYGE